MNAYGVKACVVDWGAGVFASCCRRSNCLLACAVVGHISTTALALADQLPLPVIVKRGWSGFIPIYKNPWL